MRLRPPPRIPDNPQLDEFLRDVYHSCILAVGFMTPCWSQTNAAAAQTNVALNLLDSTTNTQITFPVMGNVVGISVASNAARTAGTLTVVPVINGTASTTLSAALDGTNTTYSSGIQQHVNDPFEENQSIGIQITTDAAWAPATADIVVNLFILF